jgi:hypothetical protein
MQWDVGDRLPQLVVVFLDRSGRRYVLDISHPQAHDAVRSMPSEEVAMEHQFFIRQQNLKLYRGLVAASEAAAAKADARQEKHLKLLAEEVANEPPPRKN